MNKTVIIAVCGKAASGKDTIAKKLSVILDAHNIISDTTRPCRKNEKQDIDYHFIKNYEFLTKIKSDRYLEHSCFNNWYYGTDKEEIKEGINIGVFNKDGLESLLSVEQNSSEYIIIPVFIKSNLKTRIKRYIQRDKMSLEMFRRIAADEKDFFNFEDEILNKFNNSIKISNNSDDIRDIIDIAINTKNRIKEILI